MNEITMCIVNYGDDYNWRCMVARNVNAHWRFMQWAHRVWGEAERQKNTFGQAFSVAQMAQAVAELDAYYLQHIKEL